MRAVLNRIRIRKTWVLILASLAVALFAMLLFYVHGMPEKTVMLYFEPLEERNAASLGSEYRINYIMTDETFLPLNTYADRENWRYDGALVTYGDPEPLSIPVTAKRKVEISMKKGTYMKTGIVGVEGENQTIDFYNAEDNKEWLLEYSVSSFWNPFSLAIGLFVFCLCFLLMVYLSRWITFPQYLDEPVVFSDGLIVFCIVFFSILFCINGTDRIGAKGIYGNLDIAMYVAGGKKILNGFVPYAQHYEEKGPVVLLLCALGEKIWFPYGVYILTIMLFLVGMIFLYLAMRQVFSKYVSLLGFLSAILCCKANHAGGINTEILSIPFICIAIYIFTCFLRRGKIGNGWLVLCGGCFAATLLMRVSNAWIWVAGVPIILYQTWKKETIGEAFRKLLFMGCGVSCVILPIIGWLALNGALNEWLTDTIFYVGLYKSDAGIGQKIWDGAARLNQTHLKWWWFIPVVVTCYDAYQLSAGKRMDVCTKLFLYLSAVLGFFCAIMSGRVWAHNLLMLFPVCAFFGAYFIRIVQGLFGKNQAAAFLVPVMLFCASASEPFTDLISGLQSSVSYFGYDRLQMLRLSNYIQASADTETAVAVFSTDGTLGAVLENTLVDNHIWTYAYLPSHGEQREAHIEKYMEGFDSRPEFFAAGRTMDDIVEEYIYDHYRLVLETGNYLLFQLEES